MDQDRLRYLRLQLELGGSEVILSTPFPAGGSSEKGAARSSATPAPSSDPSGPPADRPAGLPRWLRDAPPIPGPGLTIRAPDGGPLGQAGSIWSSLEEVAAVVHHCNKCLLCQERKQTVPGEGNPAARLMLVGEGPGAREDETGRPFVGKAGDLLNGILASIDLAREEVFIANVVKCRPPGNRKPLPEEAAACLPYLERQIALIQPGVLLALGATAAEALLGIRRSLGELRGRVHSYHGIPLVVTYHPAALLRNPNWKKPTWDDVRIARQLLER
jgi:DNA polymerase